MIKFKSVKKRSIVFLLFILPALIITIQSCKKRRSEMATVLFKKTHNQIFRDVTSDGFTAEFKKVFDEERPKLDHADLIYNFYQKNNYEPVFVMNHLFNGDLAAATDYYEHADEHGLNAAMFRTDEIEDLVGKFTAKNRIKTLNETYHDMAKLEIIAASSLIDYSNDLQYGVINPKYIYQRYFITTQRPDSNAMNRVFHIGNMQAYLDSIQPKDPQYIALQNALKVGFTAKDISQEETKRILMVNLERLRWKNKPAEEKYVAVNIPDYTLDVVDSGKSVLNMKVCVGQGRNVDNKNTLSAYNDTCKVDKPGEHETPLLNSMIYGVEVNPIWNIPKSIANKEIIVQAAKDKFYLANNNINVYKDGKLVNNPEAINWNTITPKNLPYEFKQQPGSDNSLGLIKFMFNNESDVYLHDTPAKAMFYRKMRAVSHGCVRLGDPKALALSLFGNGNKFQTISKIMGKEDVTDPTMIYLAKKVAVYITYKTCWADDNNNLQFRNDVYGLDIVLYDHLNKVLHPEMN